MLFIDLRAGATGGDCAREASVWNDGAGWLSNQAFSAQAQGRDLVLLTHGFNVNRADGILALSRWQLHMQLPPSCLCVGVLWPGDARLLHLVDYPFEGDTAMAGGRLLAQWLNRHAATAASLSLVSHSLGARLMLETLNGVDGGVRHLVLMAGAIADDCLSNEYRAAAGKAQSIHILSSKEDWVLAGAFPVGNLLGDVVLRDHPYFRRALGLQGPADPAPLRARGAVWQLPPGWDFGHLDYLPSSAQGPRFRNPIAAPAIDAPVPIEPQVAHWKPAWSACFVASLLR